MAVLEEMPPPPRTEDWYWRTKCREKAGALMELCDLVVEERATVGEALVRAYNLGWKVGYEVRSGEGE